ncbi:MAG: DUF3782 domain-containing protein [Anaerolineae bacterium]|nr:DUF3782 domain-containing protein [Anaerolineae bacterium]
MEEPQIKQVIMRELPEIIQQDPEVQDFIVQLARRHCADRQDTESRFDRLLEELRRDREIQDRKWEANQQELRAMREESERKWEANQQELRRMREESERKWEEYSRRWEANQQALHAMREESERKWEEYSRRWEANQQELRAMREESERKWEEHSRRWEANQQALHAMREESERKWEANQQELRAMREESERKWEARQEELRTMREESERKWEEHQRVIRRMVTTIGALGARWGVHTEQSFRNALKGILEEEFKVEVINIVEYDDTGEVFGRPDQVELDLIIRDGTLIICEIKSSMSKADMYLFERKARFYEKRHGRKASQLVVISPMVDEPAKVVAERLGIRVYSHAEDLDPAILA